MRISINLLLSLDWTECLFLAFTQVRMPEINNQNHPEAFTMVPDLVLEGIVEYDSLAFIPCPSRCRNKQSENTEEGLVDALNF